MKRIILLLATLVLSAGLFGLHAQVTPASLAEIRSFETKIDSMEQLVLVNLQATTPGFRYPNKYKSVKARWQYGKGMPDSRMMVRGKFKLEKKRNQVVHKQVVRRALKPGWKGNLRVATRRINGEIAYARVKDQATETVWVYHARGFLKEKNPANTKVWYYLKPKQ